MFLHTKRPVSYGLETPRLSHHEDGEPVVFHPAMKPTAPAAAAASVGVRYYCELHSATTINLWSPVLRWTLSRRRMQTSTRSECHASTFRNNE